MSVGMEMVKAVIDDLEARASSIETAAVEYRSTAAHLRSVYRVGLTPANPDQAAAAPAAPVAVARVKAPKGEKTMVGRPPSKPAVPREEISPRIMDFLNQQTAPVRILDVRVAVSAKAQRFNAALAELEGAGKVVRTGTTNGTRVGTPATMRAAAAPAPPKTPQPPPASATPQPAPKAGYEVRFPGFGKAVDRLFAAGVSYDKREILRRLRSGFPTAEMVDVEQRLKALLANTLIERISDSCGDRFRKLPNWKIA